MSDCDLQLVRPLGQCIRKSLAGKSGRKSAWPKKMTTIIEYATGGSLRGVAGAIEEYARAQGRVNALVVPWESDAAAITLAVTSVKADEWAIEHTNLGTIRLTDLKDDLVAVTISA